MLRGNLDNRQVPANRSLPVMFSTSSTLTAYRDWLRRRIAWSRSASTTIVMRETSGFSVRPTVSESILNARRRNSEATRVKTPGLFSTCTTNVFSIFSHASVAVSISGFGRRIISCSPAPAATIGKRHLPCPPGSRSARPFMLVRHLHVGTTSERCVTATERIPNASASFTKFGLRMGDAS